ncbi:hypothetical protein L1987_22871 [Smallanthus sonchifolius]|uniref:Uncharacterized protein n=1 Tax=Smallanthus sonchifolius TaxID=185202 RepID=A0ACB9IIQ3_9ASTR|nr:hypothetical protein L1987_22871 [Smallanthus sonchifolius]
MWMRRCLGIDVRNGELFRTYTWREKSLEWGKRSAFMRFLKVKDPTQLVQNLSSMWIDSYHLFTNEARFDKKDTPRPRKYRSKPVLEKVTHVKEKELASVMMQDQYVPNAMHVTVPFAAHYCH